MKHKFILYLIVCFIISAILLTGCSSSDIKTSVGDLSISRAETVKEFLGQEPKGLTDAILLIYFESEDEIDSANFQSASRSVVVSDFSGNEYPRAFSGFESGEFVLGFVVPEWMTEVTLHWPENEPIEVEISK